MNIRPLSSQESVATGFSHEITVTSADTAALVGADVKTLSLLPILAGSILGKVAIVVKTAFGAAADAAFVSLTAALGDGTTATRFLAATQIAALGTPVTYAAGAGGALTTTAIATVDGSDAGTTQTLANAIKSKVNTLITDLAGQVNRNALFAADGNLVLTLTPTGGKSVSALDSGDLRVLVMMVDLKRQEINA